MTDTWWALKVNGEIYRVIRCESNKPPSLYEYQCLIDSDWVYEIVQVEIKEIPNG